jgi:hypothetical protein
MDRREASDIDPALWFHVPLSRDNVLGLVAAAKAGVGFIDDHLVGAALGSIGAMEDWLAQESTQRLDYE